MKYKEKRKEKQMNLIDLVEEKQIKEEKKGFKFFVAMSSAKRDRVRVPRSLCEKCPLE
jgi:hypothetical protein